ncbi:hypothetical protein C7S17_4668 [Burkholderia thailandensis]|nr:hypothetical protein [Burkholderia thailandensis]
MVKAASFAVALLRLRLRFGAALVSASPPPPKPPRRHKVGSFVQYVHARRPYPRLLR